MARSPNRLLFISERFPPDVGGVSRSADRLTQSLVQLGLSLEVLTWSRYLQPGEVMRQAVDTPSGSLSVHRVGLYRQWDMTLPHTLNVLDWLHDDQPFQAVWGHYLFPAAFVAVWFAQLKGLPSLVSARGNDVDRAMFPPGDFARLQWTLAQATQIAAVSQNMAHKVQCLSQRQDVQVLHNGVNTDEFHANWPPDDLAQLRQSLGIAPQETVLGFSGELREKKGQRFLLQTLAQVQQVRPACLLVIGEVRPSAQTLIESFANDHPQAADRIVITGHLPDPKAVARHLSLCDVYLQPSLWEGLPNALLEAMACERCCIASDAGGIPEVMESGKTGFLLPRSQLHHLGDAVLECLSLPLSERQEIGKRAGNLIRTRFSLMQEQTQLKALLQGLYRQ
ncbi:MAG: glycosyltransferase family 4 protein [Cyanobacteria bacterium Co-bin8]|nr:glycosyltransferase family 4 protein [Cyanobacteria bacterium Co-bin8]